MQDNLKIRQKIFDKIFLVLGSQELSILDDFPLIGDNRVLNSMQLLELCLSLEDMASEIGFEFDWTSESAMSKHRSMFRSAGVLVAEFISQMESKK